MMLRINIHPWFENIWVDFPALLLVRRVCACTYCLILTHLFVIFGLMLSVSFTAVSCCWDFMMQKKSVDEECMQRQSGCECKFL